MQKRILAIAAHPDDAEFHAGGLLVKASRAGHEVRVVALTNGNAGHHHMAPAALASRRREEARRALARLGGTSEVWDNPDGELVPTIELRRRLIRSVRAFRPHLMLTHRTNDYHPDHRATGQVVQDACYLMRVPHIVPEVEALEYDPVVALMTDFFERPAPFRPDRVLSIDAVFDEVVALLDCHASQVYEWLPHMHGITDVPEDRAARRRWLADFYGRHPAAVAKRFGANGRYAEAFEISEYGGRLDGALDEALFGG